MIGRENVCSLKNFSSIKIQSCAFVDILTSNSKDGYGLMPVVGTVLVVSITSIFFKQKKT